MSPSFQIELSETEALLCQCISASDEKSAVESACRLIEIIGDENAYEMATRNRVASHVAHRLQAATDEDPVDTHWAQAYEDVVNCLSSYVTELDRIAERLYDAGIIVVALKNGGILRGIYPVFAMSPMGDIDVLVKRADFRLAHQILITEGYQLEFRSPLEDNDIVAAEKSGGAEYCKILSDGQPMWLELQWRPVAGRWLRPEQEPPAEELISRSIAIPGTKVRVLCPEDNLLQVALHTAKHSYVRAPGFRLHTDVDRIVRFQEIDWKRFVYLVESLQVQTSVYFSLAIPKQLFATPVPQHVLSQLLPPKWKSQIITRLINRAGIFNPDEPKFGRVSYIFFTLLLFDNFNSFWKALFPTPQWMYDRYQFHEKIKLPYYYLRRLLDLSIRRMPT